MTDKERREDDALKKLIQSAYDFSDEQLLADLEETEATLSDSDFPGIEDRMFLRLKERLKEEQEELREEFSREEREEVQEEISEDVLGEMQEELPENVSGELPKERSEANSVPTIAPIVAEKKVVRFGKRKAVVVGLLAAAFVGMLGVTAIGEKNYFFRDMKKTVGVAFDNDKNISYTSDLESAYTEIEERLGIQALKMGHMPEGMKLLEIEYLNNKVSLIFQVDSKLVYFIQEVQENSASVSINSDRQKLPDIIENRWISGEIWLEEEITEDGTTGYAVQVAVGNVRYRIIGQLPKEEMIKIAEKLYFL